MKLQRDDLVIHVWVGDFGVYKIPEALHTPFRADGWPDMRYRRARALLEWVREQELNEINKVDEI